MRRQKDSKRIMKEVAPVERLRDMEGTNIGYAEGE